MGWLDSGRPQLYPDTVLRFAADQKHVIRLEDDKPPVQVWRHTARNEMGAFLQVLCVGPRNGCEFCKTNKDPKLAHIKENQQRPYPVGSQYVKPAFVINEGVWKLLVGNDVWKSIEALFDEFGTVVNRNVSITRDDSARKGSYKVVAQDRSEHTFPSGLVVPKVDDYREWLRENVAKADMVSVDDFLVKMSASATPPVANKASEETRTDEAAPGGRREELLVNLGKAFKTFDTRVVNSVLNEITPGNSDIEKLTDDQLESFIAKYQVATKK